MSDIKFILTIGFILAFFSALIILEIPEELRLLDNIDLTLLGARLVSIAGACVAVDAWIAGVAGVLACSATLIIWTAFDWFTYALDSDILSLLFIPMNLVLTYIMVKLARGSS